MVSATPKCRYRRHLIKKSRRPRYFVSAAVEVEPDGRFFARSSVEDPAAFTPPGYLAMASRCSM